MEKEKYIALQMNDVHISPSNIPDVILNFNEAFDICKENNVKDIIIAGDLFTHRDAQRLNTLIALRDIFKEARRRDLRIILSPGNHDKVNQEKIESYCHVYSEFDCIDVVDEYMLLEYDNVAIHIIPYFPEDGSFKRRLSEVSLKKDKINVLSIHEGINGALSHSSGDSNKELPANIFDIFDLVLVGHYHNRAKINNIQYIGSSRQHNFGEDIYKGYTLIDEFGKDRFIQNKVNSRFIDLCVSFDEINDDLYEDIIMNTEDGFNVRVIVTCSKAQKPQINKQKIFSCGASKVKVMETDLVTQSPESFKSVRYNKDGLRKGYSEYCDLKGISPTYGLKYL